MILPAKVQWKAVSDKEVASLENNIVYTLLPATSVPSRHKTIASRWVSKIKADHSKNGRIVVSGWGRRHRCFSSRKRPEGTQADQAETDEPFLNNRQRKPADSAKDGCNPWPYGRGSDHHQDNYTKSLLGRYGMASCHPAFMPDVGTEISLDQPEKTLLLMEDNHRFRP